MFLFSVGLPLFGLVSYVWCQLLHLHKLSLRCLTPEYPFKDYLSLYPQAHDRTTCSIRQTFPEDQSWKVMSLSHPEKRIFNASFIHQPVLEKKCFSSCTAGYDGLDRFMARCHLHVKTFLQGAHRLRPPTRHVVPQWDLQMALQAYHFDLGVVRSQRCCLRDSWFHISFSAWVHRLRGLCLDQAEVFYSGTQLCQIGAVQLTPTGRWHLACGRL